MRIGVIGFLGLSLLLLLQPTGGCGKPDEPEAIWDSSDSRIHPLVYPRGIAYSPAADEFFVVDRMARIQRISGDGRFICEWRMPEQQQGKPVGIAVGPDGNIYVPDTHYHRVIVYTPDGRELRRWGTKGAGPGEFIYPTDIAFASNGRVLVSEYGDNDRIQVFDAQGNYLYQFGRFGQKAGEFSRPQSMLVDKDLLYLTDACNHRIEVFTVEGKFVREMGTVGSGPGQFRFPFGLVADLDGNLIVTEFGNNRVQKIAKDSGRCMWTLGQAGRETGEMAYPWASVVDKRGRLVVLDSGNNRLQVFRGR
jgi:DNA-binding beta-propeller fold protein YncE